MDSKEKELDKLKGKAVNRDLSEREIRHRKEIEHELSQKKDKLKRANAIAQELKKEKEEKKPAPELSAEELGKLATEIKGLAAKVEDEAMKEKLEKIAEKLEGGKEEGTRPDVVKEAVSILSL